MGYAQVIVKLPLWMRHAIIKEALDRSTEMGLDMDFVDSMFENSKNDKFLIVGSDVRMLCRYIYRLRDDFSKAQERIHELTTHIDRMNSK